MLDIKQFVTEIKNGVAQEALRLRQESGVVPKLVVIRVGDDPASEIYVSNKVRTSLELGLLSEQIIYPAETPASALLVKLAELNSDDSVDGILVQSPLPPHIDEQTIVKSIDPKKDVDGFHPVNVGLLSLGQQVLTPCTPLGMIALLDRMEVPISGANACVVGRSNIVGKPVAQLLLQRNATVTICHSRTKDLPSFTSRADILIAATGRPGLIRAAHVKPGAVVLDVGMNPISDPELAKEIFGDDLEKRLETIERRGSTLAGDVNQREVRPIASYLSPVPGGVGLLTVAMLMKNTMIAAKRRRGL